MRHLVNLCAEGARAKFRGARFPSMTIRRVRSCYLSAIVL